MAIDFTNAETIVKSYLATYGLDSLAPWAIQTMRDNPALDAAGMKTLIADQPAFKARFPALETLQKSGKAISVDAYMAYEQQTRQMLQQYGVPEEMYGTSERIKDLLLNDVSAAEMNQRLQLASQAAMTAPEETRRALASQYGITGGGLVAYWLDPDKAQPILEKQFAAATITGAADRQKIALGIAESERLAALGITGSQAAQGFGEVAQRAGLQAGTGERVNQETLIAAQFGDSAAQAAVDRVAGGRVAEFRQSGGATDSQSGVAGLGKGNG